MGTVDTHFTVLALHFGTLIVVRHSLVHQATENGVLIKTGEEGLGWTVQNQVEPASLTILVVSHLCKLIRHGVRTI